MKEHIFLYGTLRSESGSDVYRDYIAPWCTRVGTGTLPGRLYSISWYPGLVQDDVSHERVVGEIHAFETDSPVLAQLDQYEGCTPDAPSPHEYERVLRKVTLNSGKTLETWVYLYQWPIDKANPILSGDFLKP